MKSNIILNISNYLIDEIKKAITNALILLYNVKCNKYI